MSELEINDPDLRRQLLGKLGPGLMITENGFETACLTHSYLQNHALLDTLSSDSRAYLECFEWFFAIAANDYAPAAFEFTGSLVDYLIPLLQDGSIDDRVKVRTIYACGNVLELNRILIDIVNELHRAARKQLNKKPGRSDQ